MKVKLIFLQRFPDVSEEYYNKASLHSDKFPKQALCYINVQTGDQVSIYKYEVYHLQVETDPLDMASSDNTY